MKILVTGAKGFVGRNLCAQLNNIKDGKARCYGDVTVEAVYEYDLDSTPEELDAWCKDCDFVFNLAGVNRPQNQEEFMQGNFGFASTLLDTLKKHGNKCPVMLSSSQQASLTGRFGNSEYGRSKKAGEDLFLEYERNFLKNSENCQLPTANCQLPTANCQLPTANCQLPTANCQLPTANSQLRPRVLIYRFPNLFGKWCRPNYNSAVATFCNAFANDLPYTVNDPSVELELLYIDDLVDEMIACLKDEEHHCEFEGLDVLPKADGRYCHVPTTHKITLGGIVDLLKSFAEQPQTLMIPEIPANSFAKKLYSTYLSYLPKEKVAFPLKMNVDDRGSFTELVHTLNCGQVSINISKPGITKGQHWHNTKWEFFIVVSGHGLIQERKLGTDEIIEFEVSGDNIQCVHMLPGYTHNIINLSDTENLVTVMYCNEIFNPNKPDTYFEKV
jgi:UDP-2-acetamido-2,6-beta-L-arabino-hexul-4-ose reductase